MRKFIICAIPIAALVLFIIIMQSGNLLKRPLGNKDDIPRSINDMIEAVNMESWDEAYNKLKDIEYAWDKVVKRVQFSSEKDEIEKIYACIARLHGAVMAEDKSNALMELYEAYNHWDNLGN